MMTTNFDTIAWRNGGPLRILKLLMSLSVLYLASCNSSKIVEFPAQALTGYAFVVYAKDKVPTDVSPIRNAEYYANLIVSAKSDVDYDTIDFYTVDPAKLAELAEMECRSLDSAKGRISCLQAVESCEQQADCWRALSSSEGCNERISISLENSILEYFRESGGIFVPQSPQSPGQSELVICGPVANPACPYRTPSYVVTKEGFFHCNAEATQQSCSLSLDFSECGIDAVVGALDESGRFQPSDSKLGRCTIEAPSNEIIPSLGASDFSIVCESERYEVTYSDNVLGEQLCPHLGPSTYDDDSNIGGEITGLANFGNTHTVMVGSGDNHCAYYGYYCSLRESSCVDCCYDTCNAYLLTRCIEQDDQKTCAEPPRTDCIEQCRKCCADSSNCTRSYREGHSAVVLDPEQPYTFKSRIKLEQTGRVHEALHQGHAIAKLHSSGESHTFIAGLSEGAVFFEVTSDIELRKADQKIEANFAVSRLYHYDQSTFLTGTLTSSIAALLIIDYGDISEPFQSYSTRQIELPSIGQIEHLAVADSKLYLATSVYEAGRVLSRITSFDRTTMLASNEIEIPGRISVLRVFDNLLIVSTFDKVVQQETILFLNLDLSEHPQAELPMLKGLSVQDSLVDEDAKRIYLGLKLSNRTGSLGSGALSIFEKTKDGYRILPPLFVTNIGAIDLLNKSHNGKKVYAISRTKNWVMPFEILGDD